MRAVTRLTWLVQYPTTRHGYRLKNLVEQFDAKPSEIKALFRAVELLDKMLAAGLPI